MIYIPKQKEGYKRVMGEIPEDMYNKITWYNKIGSFSLNVSRAIEICLSKEVEKIEQEAIDYVKRNGGLVRGNNESYYKALEGIKNGLLAYEVYKIAIEDMHVQPKQHLLRSQVYLPLLPVNRMKFNEDKETICFFVDDMFCCKVSPYESRVLSKETIEYLNTESVENLKDENSEE